MYLDLPALLLQFMELALSLGDLLLGGFPYSSQLCLWCPSGDWRRERARKKTSDTHRDGERGESGLAAGHSLSITPTDVGCSLV